MNGHLPSYWLTLFRVDFSCSDSTLSTFTFPSLTLSTLLSWSYCLPFPTIIRKGLSLGVSFYQFWELREFHPIPSPRYDSIGDLNEKGFSPLHWTSVWDFNWVVETNSISFFHIVSHRELLDGFSSRPTLVLNPKKREFNTTSISMKTYR